ncbi:unnamed protein product [Hydatigera taeniaeformis]|uniref:Uncharacterized protein n=1 Tax=Hydatigena taeniaeformis TaxID=6205 RepID=A0A0R3WJX1_HYDTA|nr:unnamed protein product [Hydatigera taeniaeformis]
MYCHSTGKCLVFPVARLGMVSWSSCPPNLSALYWYSCRISYAYFLALAIATFVFVGLLFLSTCVLCFLRHRRCRHTNITGTASVARSSSSNLRPSTAYHYARHLVRNDIDVEELPESSRLLDSPQCCRNYGRL